MMDVRHSGPVLQRLKDEKIVLIGLVAALGILVAVYAFRVSHISKSEYGHARTYAQGVIDRCHEQASAPSRSAGERRSIAEACERLESEYRQTWNTEP